MNDTLIAAPSDTQVYFIADSALPLLERRLASIAKAAAKVGAAFAYQINPNRFKDVEIKLSDGKKSFLRQYEVTVTGTRPCYNGWNFRGTIEHTVEGNVLRLVPGVAGVPEAYRENRPCCDHCQVNRVRRDTYIVQHDNGDYRQVGSNCLKDFLGHKNPQEIARLASLWLSFAEAVEGTSNGGSNELGARPRFDLENFLTNVAAVIRVEDRYISRKLARENERLTATACIADDLSGIDHNWHIGSQRHMNDLREKYSITDADRELAKAARAFIIARYSKPVPADCLDSDDDFKDFIMDLNSAREGVSEFEHNMFVVAKGQSVELRTTGIAAYIVQHYRKENGLLPERKAKKPSHHIGTVKNRLRDLTVHVDGIAHIPDTGFGSLDIVRMSTPEGNVVIWKTGSGHDLLEGYDYTIDATVTRHNDYKGTPQTQVNRVTVKTGIVQLQAA